MKVSFQSNHHYTISVVVSSVGIKGPDCIKVLIEASIKDIQQQLSDPVILEEFEQILDNALKHYIQFAMFIIVSSVKMITFLKTA